MCKETIKLKDGRTVLKSDYIKARTGDLINFGYAGLTESEVECEVNKILKGDTDLTVIGMICEDDIIKPH